jgi:uncharacterized protein YceK
MRLSWIVLVASALAVSSPGCGTLLNLKSGHPEPFGGVQRDIEFLNTPAEGDREFKTNGDYGIFAAVIMGVWGADLCASGICDTLMLPFLARRDEKKDREDREKAEREGYAGLPPQYSCGAVVGDSSSPSQRDR